MCVLFLDPLRAAYTRGAGGPQLFLFHPSHTVYIYTQSAPHKKNRDCASYQFLVFDDKLENEKKESLNKKTAPLPRHCSQFLVIIDLKTIKMLLHIKRGQS
eukprot:GEMP01086072.1.p2 GENE.GEMP01086072.1~~GEMP01086072.1.p2  ORF type:complete len:101 (-),score=7.64 GEMP01086072.1:29-331(-)